MEDLTGGGYDPAMQAVLLSIGDELVLGQTVDTNTAWIAEQLARRGLTCARHETIADDLSLIADAFRRAARDADLVIVTGGLGPTADDLTRDALADAMGVELNLHAPSLDRIEAFFARRGKTMAERNRVQAMCPDGATMLDNDAGTAPGIRSTLKGATVFVAPGVPREMRSMFEAYIAPFLAEHAGQADTLLTTKVNTFGLGESDVAEQLGDLMQRDRNPTVGTTVSQGLCSIRVRSRFGDAGRALRELEDTVEQVMARVGPVAFSRDETTLQESTVSALREAGLTVATAESCTGGLVGQMLTDVPGSSVVFTGGWVTYSNDMKSGQLGVDPTLIEQYGAVSPEVAAAMASGCRSRSGADLAVSLTGIAGPEGGTDDKPVGTVWIGLASVNGTQTFLARLAGPRSVVRDRAAKCALQLLRLTAMGEDPAAISWLTAETAAR